MNWWLQEENFLPGDISTPLYLFCVTHSLKKKPRKQNGNINNWNITEIETALVSSTVLNPTVPKLTRKQTNKQFPLWFETFTLSRKAGKLSRAKHKRRKHCRFQWELAISEGTFGTKAYPWSQQDDCKIHYKVRHGVLAPGWTEGCNINTWFITAELEPGYSGLQKLGMVHIKRIFPGKRRASSPALENH